MSAVTASARRRMIATAGLLTSDKDGEALNAARALVRLLDQHGMDPAAVIGAGLAQPVAASMPPRSAACNFGRHQFQARLCAGFPQYLTSWESNFLASIARQRTITAKQRDRLNEIIAKIERERQ